MNNTPDRYRTSDEKEFVKFVTDNLEIGEKYQLNIRIIFGRSYGDDYHNSSRITEFSYQGKILAELAIGGLTLDKGDEKSESKAEIRKGKINSINQSLGSSKRIVNQSINDILCVGLISLEGVVNDYQVLINPRTDVYEVIPYMRIELEPNTVKVQGQEVEGTVPRILIPFSEDVQKAKQNLRFGAGSELLVEIISETGNVNGEREVVPNTAYTFDYVPKRILRDDLPSEEAALGKYSETEELVAARKRKGKLFETDDPEAVKKELLEKEMPEHIKPLLKSTKQGTLL